MKTSFCCFEEACKAALKFALKTSFCYFEEAEGAPALKFALNVT
jgi:hypothetical protein